MHLTMMHMGIIIATLVCVIGIGIYSSRSVRSAAGYSVGGRSAGAPLVAGSIAGTVVGGGATVGTAQLAYHLAFPRGGSHWGAVSPSSSWGFLCKENARHGA